MPNAFDQFDTTTEQPRGNPFDAFDSSKNPFDDIPATATSERPPSQPGLSRAAKLAPVETSTTDKVLGTVPKAAYAFNEGIASGAEGVGRTVAELSDPGPLKNTYRNSVKVRELAANNPQWGEDAIPRAFDLLHSRNEIHREQARAPGEALSQGAKEVTAEWKALRDKTPGYETPAKIAETAGGVLPFIAESTIPVIGPELAAVHGAMQSGGNEFDQAYEALKQHGMSDEDARAKASEIATAVGLGTGLIFSRLPGGAKALPAHEAVSKLTSTGKAALHSGAVMAVDTEQRLVNEKASYRPELTPQEMMTEGAKSFAIGAVIGGVAHGATEVARGNPPDDVPPGDARYQKPPAESQEQLNRRRGIEAELITDRIMNRPLSRANKMGGNNAVQEQGTTTIPIRHGTETGATVAKEVRPAEEPAGTQGVPVAGEEDVRGTVTPPPAAETVGTASSGQTTFHPYEIARDAEKPPVEDKVESMTDPAKYPVKRVDPKTLKLSAEVPNFKGNADLATGEVTPIEGGHYDYRDTGAVQVWVRLNGDREIISGRHRWNQALRTNSEIPVQEHFESEGFTANHARILDAELNIRDGQGEVSDYANYFRNTKQLYDEASAGARGLLRGAKARTGWHLGHNASDDLYSLWAAGRINDARAVAIASAAPGDANLQRFGIKAAQEGADPGQIVARLESARAYQGTQKAVQTGFDDIFGGGFAELEAKFKREGDYVAKRRQALQDIITTRSAILRRFDVATSSGSIKANAKQAQKELDQAQAAMERWKNWALDADLKAEVEAATGTRTAETAPKTPPTPLESNEIKPTNVLQSPPDTGTGDMFGDSVPTKPAEQVAEEKRLKEQKLDIAEGQGKPLTGAVDTTMDMLDNSKSDIPLLTQNPNLKPPDKQGSLGVSSWNPEMAQSLSLDRGKDFSSGDVGNYWIDPQGHAFAVQNHGLFARGVSNKLGLPYGNTIDAYDNLFGSGWVRVVISEDTNTIYLQSERDLPRATRVMARDAAIEGKKDSVVWEKSSASGNDKYTTVIWRDGDTQGKIGDATVAEGTEASAVGVDRIRELIRRPESNLPAFAVRVIDAMLDTPVMRNLDWSRLELVIRNQVEGGYAGSASVLDHLIELSRNADADTFPHEVFHFLFEMLPTEDRLTVDTLRREAVQAFPREGLSPAAVAALDKLSRGETLASDDFSHDLPRELYPLINPSEFLAQMAGNKFASGVFEARSQGIIGQLVDRVKGYVRGIVDSLRRVFGVRPSLEQIYRELLAGRQSKSMLDSVVTYAKRKQGSFSRDAEAARNAEMLAQTNEQREVEATHQLAQAHDIVDILGKHGAGTVGDASKTLLGWWDYLGIDAAGRRLNGGIGEGYRQLKARIADKYRQNWLARMAHQQFSLLERKMTDIITQRDEEATKLSKPGFLKLLARETVAKAKMDNADNVLRITQSIFHSAITMARKALVQEGKSDREIAMIEGELKALDDAEKSSAGMQQLLTDMVAAIGSSDAGVEMLTNPSVGTRASLIKEYRTMKAAVGQPVHNENLIRWAAYILHKSKDLRETLLASHWAANAPIRAAMGPYEVKFLADFEHEPIKTVKREIRTQSKLATDAQKAAFAWRILHQDVTRRLDEFAVMDDAAGVASNVLADPDVASLRSEIKDDAQVLGAIEPAKPFTKNSVLLPDGTSVEIDPQKLVGSRTEFAAVRAGFEASINTLRTWLNNPAHAGDINYRMHERNLATIEDYFAGLSMLHPNDPLRLIKRSFEIVRNAVNVAGGRVAAQVRVALATLDHDSREASWWTQRYTNLLATSAQTAIRSHGIKYSAFGETSVHDANKQWYERVGNQLFYSFNRAAGGMKVGDMLASGERVTQADMDHVRLTSEAISKGFNIVGDKQLTQDTLGGFTTFRKALKGNPLMTVRVFNDDLANFSTDFLGHRTAYLEATKAGDVTKAAAAEAKMLSTLDAYFARIGTAMTWDRNPEFAKATAFDGPGGTFEVVGERMSSHPGMITNTREYFDALASRSAMTPDEAKDVILAEWGRIIEAWNREAVQTETPDVPRAEETKNSFTRSRNDALAPFVFYENGFRNSHSVQKFGSGIQSRAMDGVVNGLDALLADIDRQQKDFADEVARTSGAPKAAEKQVRTKRAVEKANGDNYDSFENLERRKKLVKDARDLMADKANDTDVDVTAGRYIGALTGMLIGTVATARNVTSGPRYIGQLGRRLTASNLRSNPLAMWYGWLDMPVRMMASFAYGVPKAALFDLPVGAGKAIAGLSKPQQRNVESFVHTLFRDVIKELGENIYTRVSEVKRMIDAGVHHVPDAVAEWDNKLMGTWLTHGLILEHDLPTIDKVLQTPVALVETLILSFQKTLMPMFGDTGLNMATSMLMKSKFGPFQQLEHTLRRVYADYKASGYRAFDFANPRSDANVLSYKEMFPRGIREMRASSSERDMQNVREQFESAGLNFDEKATEFLAQLDAGKIDAQLLNAAERDALTNSAIDFTNRASLTNNPLNLKRKNFINNLIKPFMFWKVRSLSNFLNDLSTSSRTDARTRDAGHLFRQRAAQVAVASTMILLPLLFWGAMTNVGDEEANRRLKLALFNQITGFRQPWEREGTGSQSRGWLVHAFNGVPFLDMAMNTMFNDMPNRATFDPSLAAVEKAKDVARYIGGVAQTGDITYKLPQLIGGLFPDAKIVMSRMESQSGLREINNVAALVTRHGPTELLRPSRTGASGGVMANELTPYADRMVNAAAAGNMAEFQQVYEEAVKVAREMGRADPEKVVGQMFRSRNPYARALKAEMTPGQREAFLATLSPEERARVQSVESNLTRAGELIGAKVSFVSGDEGRSGTSSGTAATGAPPRGATGGFGAIAGGGRGSLSRAGRVGRTRLPRSNVRLARVGRVGRSGRRGFARLSRAPRLA